MIKLTYQETTDHVYINPDALRSFNASGKNGTLIRYMDGANCMVSESPDTVARLITEYKQRQMRLQAAYNQLYSIQDEDSLIDMICILQSEDRGE